MTDGPAEEALSRPSAAFVAPIEAAAPAPVAPPGAPGHPPQPAPQPAPKAPPTPSFQSLWNKGEGLARLGTTAEDVQLLDTVCRSFAATWRGSYGLPDLGQGRLERERLAVAWARVLLDVRARDLKRRAERVALTPTAFDSWDQVTRELTADLQAFGWRLAGEEDLALAKTGEEQRLPDLARVKWYVPPTEPSTRERPRWVLPPVIAGSSAAPSVHSPATRAELAVPVPAPSGWHAPVLSVAWAAEGAKGEGFRTAATRTLWKKAGEIDRRLGDAALRGIDSGLKQFILEEYWEPLYALAYEAKLVPAESNPIGHAWLRELGRQLAAAQLVLHDVSQPDAGHCREPAAGEPDARPAILDAETGRVASLGLLRRGGAQPAGAREAGEARAAREAGEAAGVGGSTDRYDISARRLGADGTSGPEGPSVTEIAASPESAQPQAPQPARVVCQAVEDATLFLEAPPGADPSAWHARVREVFAARRRASQMPWPGEQERYRQLMRVAGKIDQRQRDFIVEPADDDFKAAVAEEYWVPLYALADHCFGLAHGASDGAGWLARMRELLGMAQLGTVEAGPNGDPDWFREPMADEPAGRPAVIDLQSHRLFSFGTRATRGEAAPGQTAAGQTAPERTALDRRTSAS